MTIVRGSSLVLLAACSFKPGVVGGGDGSTSDTADGSDMASSTLRQKTLTILPAVAGTHADFALWIALTDAELAARARADGTDIHFIIGGAPADYEIQSWTKSSGELGAWVRVPSFAAGGQVLIRYGDVAVAHAPNPAGAFAAYTAVWHFEDTLGATAIVDARGANNGTAVQLGSTDSVDGQLGRAISFGDNAEQITVGNPLSGDLPHTISVWVDQATTTTNDCIIALGNGANDQARWLHSRFNSAEIALGFYANDWTGINYDIIGDGWTLLHWVYEGTNRMSRMYVNGAQVAGPFQHQSGIDTQGTAGTIGNAPGPFGSNMGINASLDEVRITNIARDAAWIAAEALNQTTPDAAYRVSAEQTP